MTKRRALLLTALIGLTTLTSCDAAYKRLGPEYGALPPCGVQIHVVSPRGDFNEAQKVDIQAALAEIGLWSNRDVVYAGETQWRSDSPDRPKHLIFIERDNRYTGYSLPGRFAKIGSWYSTFPTLSEPSYTTGYATFRGVVLHELMHTIVGAEDMYTRDDGHPGLLMGSGMLRFNKLALGDIKAAQDGGC